MIASLIAAGASLAANVINNQRIMRNFYENRHYNTPAAQMGRFRAAGLNPNLIYSQTNESDSPPTTSAADLSALGNIPSELSQYQDIKKSKAEVNNLEKANQQIDKQIEQIVLDNILRQKEIDWFDIKNTADLDLIKAQAAKTKKDIEALDKTIENIIANTAKVTRETQKIDFDQFIETFNAILANKQFQLDVQRFNLNKDQFEEMKRQFNESNWQKDFLYEFFGSLTESGDAKDLPRALGTTVKKWFSDNISDTVTIPEKWKNVTVSLILSENHFFTVVPNALGKSFASPDSVREPKNS